MSPIVGVAEVRMFVGGCLSFFSLLSLLIFFPILFCDIIYLLGGAAPSHIHREGGGVPLARGQIESAASDLPQRQT
jgi:hypothetical protein